MTQRGVEAITRHDDQQGHAAPQQVASHEQPHVPLLLELEQADDAVPNVGRRGVNSSSLGKLLKSPTTSL